MSEHDHDSQRPALSDRPERRDDNRRDDRGGYRRDDRDGRRDDRRGNGDDDRRDNRRDTDQGAEYGTGRVRFGGRARDTDPSRRTVNRPGERAKQGDKPRTVAFETLRAVSDGAYANLELPKRLREAHLRGRDAAFATELVYGVTRMRGLYDSIIERCAGRPLAEIDPPVLDVLRLGAHQALGMRVPAHAAVDATVGLARAVVGAGPSSFTNAVLRRITEKPWDDWLRIVAPGAGHREVGADEAPAPAETAESAPAGARPFVAPTSLDDVAVAQSHPVWIVRALRNALLTHGTSTPETVDADLLDLLHAHNVPAEVALVARPGLAEVDELLDAGATPGRLSPVAAVLSDGGDPGAIPAVRTGRAAVQDEGSQLVVLTLVHAYDALRAAADAPAAADESAGSSTRSATDGPDTSDDGTSEGPRWLDLCAGPGGKAGLLAPLAIPRGATLFANEVSEHRADLVEATVAAAMDAGADVFVGVGDGRALGSEEPGGFDLVLVDAPCTGLGALRRRPDARWRRVPGDVADLTVLQEDLLRSGLDALAPGGVLGYVTCSPHAAETRQVITRVLRDRSDIEILDAPEQLNQVTRSGAGDVGSGPFVQLWPHVHGTDAMFLALLRRTTF